MNNMFKITSCLEFRILLILITIATGDVTAESKTGSQNVFNSTCKYTYYETTHRRVPHRNVLYQSKDTMRMLIKPRWRVHPHFTKRTGSDNAAFAYILLRS